MKKFFAIVGLCFVLGGCQIPQQSGVRNDVSSQQNSQQNVPQPFVQSGEFVGSTPEDQLVRTGMMRSIYSQQEQDAGAPQYYMGETQQQLPPEEYKQQLLNGPVKDCLQESGIKADLCYEDFLKKQTEAGGPEQAFKALKTLYDVSDDVRYYCHPLAHEIGHAAVDKYPTVAEAYQHGDDFCWSGYYHGVMEELMGRIGKDDLAGKLNTMCVTIPGWESYSFMYYNCVHGVGHGLMEVMGGNLFDALKMCDNFGGDWERQSCYSGVFMQNIINDDVPFVSPYLKPEDTVYPCNAVDQQYKDQCYLMQTSYMLKMNNYDFKKTFDICAHVDEGFRVTCYRSLGRDASGSTVSDLQKTHDICMSGNDYTQQSECLVGAVKDFISYYHSDVKAKQLCQSVEDKTMQQYCMTTVEDYYRSF